jgi:hypothetical protein
MARCGCATNWRIEEELRRREKTRRRSRGGEAYIYIYSPEMAKKWNDDGSDGDMRSQCAVGEGREAKKAS